MWSFTAIKRDLEYDFVLSAGADPYQIRIGFEGVDGVSIDAQGDLELTSAHGTMKQRRFQCRSDNLNEMLVELRQLKFCQCGWQGHWRSWNHLLILQHVDKVHQSGSGFPGVRH